METDKSKIYADIMEIVDAMDGHKFEYFCAKLLEQCEFRDVVVTRGSGDYGVDITARYHNRKYAIQCKRYSKNINLKAVQEVGMGAEFYHCDVAVVLCNGFFAKSAVSMAEQTGVRLWDRNYLLDLISQCENLDFVKEFVKKEDEESWKENAIKTNSKMNKKVVQQRVKSKSPKKTNPQWLIPLIIISIVFWLALVYYIAMDNIDGLQNIEREDIGRDIDKIKSADDEDKVEDVVNDS